jgi:hypothetical protein
MSFDQSDHFVPETWYGTPAFSVVGTGEVYASQQNQQFERNTRYFNYLPHAVTVLERNGLCTRFPPVADPNRCEFVIQTDWRLHRNLQTQFMQTLKDGHEVEPKSVAILRDCLRQYKPDRWDQWLTIRCEISITREELIHHDGEIYDNENDVVISSASGINAGPHPFSESGRFLTELQSRPDDVAANAFYESIRIVDNEGTNGDWFINRNGDVIQITAVRDRTRQSGIWVMRNRPHSNATSSGRIGWRRHAFDAAEDALGLYKSYAAAKHYGDTETSRKMKLAVQEAKLTRDKSRLNRQKLEQQREQQEWEREKAKTQMEMERRQAIWAEEGARAKYQHEQARYRYEQQMQEAKQAAERRKETGDWIRQLTGVLSAVALAWLAYRTAKVQAK